MKKRDDGYFRTQVELDDGIYPYKFRVRTKSSNFELNQWVDVIDPDAADVDKAAFRRAKLGYLQFASLSNRLSLHEFPNQYIIIEYPYLLHR